MTQRRSTETLNIHLHFPIDRDSALHQLDHSALQHHGDLADCWQAILHLPPHLDVEILIAALTLRGQDVVAAGRELEDVSIEGLEMVVTPCTADQFVVDRACS